jgi:hypothetical protein
MRALVLVFSLLASAAPALAQEWDEFVALQDGFRINFPGKPQVKEGTWTSQMNYTLRCVCTVRRKDASATR